MGHVSKVTEKKEAEMTYEPVDETEQADPEPLYCGLCDLHWPEFFHVPDDEWQKYVIPPLQEEILCRKCYEKQKKIFPNGWRNSNMPYKLVDETEQAVRLSVHQLRMLE